MKHSVKNKIISLVMAGAMATAVGAVSASAENLSSYAEIMLKNNPVASSVDVAKNQAIENGKAAFSGYTDALRQPIVIPGHYYDEAYSPNDSLFTQAYAVGQRQAENDTKAFHALKETGDVNQFAKSMGNNIGESLGAAKDIAQNQADQIMKKAGSLQDKYGDPRTGFKNHSYSGEYIITDLSPESLKDAKEMKEKYGDNIYYRPKVSGAKASLEYTPGLRHKFIAAETAIDTVSNAVDKAKANLPPFSTKKSGYSASYLPQGSLLNFDNENTKLPNLFENTGIMQKVGNQIRPYSNGYDGKQVKWGNPVKLDNGYIQQNYLQKKGNNNIITSVYVRPLKNGNSQIYAESIERNTKKEHGYHPLNHMGSASHPITVKKGQNPISAIFGNQK